MGRNLGFISWLFLGLLACSAPQKDAQRAELHLRIGTGLLNEGNHPAAFRELSEAYRLDPENPSILNNLAIAYYVRGKLVEAETHFREAVKAKPDFSDARINLGRVLMDRGQLDAAADEFKQVTKDLSYANPEKAHTNLGEVLAKKQNFSEARRHLTEALRLRRDYCPAHALYGKVLFLQGDFSRAAKALDNALAQCRDLDEAHYYNALSYKELGDRSRAMARMKEVLDLYPRSPFAKKARDFLEVKQ